MLTLNSTCLSAVITSSLPVLVQLMEDNVPINRQIIMPLLTHLRTPDSSPFSSNCSSLLTCYYFNAQSIVNKISELHDILYQTQPDCVLVTESWLHADICDGVLDPKSLYTIIRKDRVSSRGGGVCAFINRKHSVIPITVLDKYCTLEIIGVDFVDVKPILRMFIVYRPPYYDQNAVSYASLLSEYLTSYSTTGKYMHLIVGDFNLPLVNWKTLTGPNHDVYNTILNLFLNNGYNQLVHFPTRGCNLLDLVLTNVDMLVTSVTSHLII